MRVMLHIIAAVFFLGGAYWFVTGLNIVLGTRKEAAGDGFEAVGALLGYQVASTPLIVGTMLIVAAALIQALMLVVRVLDDAAAARSAAIARSKRD